MYKSLADVMVMYVDSRRFVWGKTIPIMNEKTYQIISLSFMCCQFPIVHLTDLFQE